MRIIRPYTHLRVKTSDGRLRHSTVQTVASQTSITARIGSATSGVTVSATRAASTPTRGVQFNA